MNCLPSSAIRRNPDGKGAGKDIFSPAAIATGVCCRMSSAEEKLSHPHALRATSQLAVKPICFCVAAPTWEAPSTGMLTVKEVLISSLIAAAFVIAAATTVFAQAAVQEPGAFAFNRPDADVLNAGRGGYRSFDSANAYYWNAGPQVRRGPTTPRHHRSAR